MKQILKKLIPSIVFMAFMALLAPPSLQGMADLPTKLDGLKKALTNLKTGLTNLSTKLEELKIRFDLDFIQIMINHPKDYEKFLGTDDGDVLDVYTSTPGLSKEEEQANKFFGILTIKKDTLIKAASNLKIRNTLINNLATYLNTQKVFSIADKNFKGWLEASRASIPQICGIIDEVILFLPFNKASDLASNFKKEKTIQDKKNFIANKLNEIALALVESPGFLLMVINEKENEEFKNELISAIETKLKFLDTMIQYPNDYASHFNTTDKDELTIVSDGTPMQNFFGSLAINENVLSVAYDISDNIKNKIITKIKDFLNKPESGITLNEDFKDQAGICTKIYPKLADLINNLVSNLTLMKPLPKIPGKKK